MESRKLFLPVLPPVQIGQRVGSRVPTVNNMLNPGNIASAYQNAPEPVKEAFRQGGQYMKDKVGERFDKMKLNARNRTGSRGRRRPPSSSDGYRGNSSSAGYGLSNAPKPAPVKLNSGIKPNTYTSDYMEATEGKCSPLHLSYCKVKIPSNAAQTLYTYFNTIVAFEAQSAAQAAVSFNINISTIFTTANILTAINSIFDALSIYYWYSSILTYFSDPQNKNEGMVYLRQQITSTDIENLTLLKRRLESTPIPPNVLEFIRYLSSNWYSGNTQGSPILKMAPDRFTTAGISGTSITTATAALSSGSNNEVFSILRRAVPSWICRSLQDVPVNPTYDENFITIFNNLPFYLWNGTAVSAYPKVTTMDETISYCSTLDDLDGLAFSMLCLYNTSATPFFYPGLITPQSTGSAIGGSSRYSYYEVSGVKGLYDANAYAFLTRSRDETYYVDNFTTFNVNSGHTLGTDKCLGVSANTVKETNFKAIDYLMSLSSIKPKMLQSRNSK